MMNSVSVKIIPADKTITAFDPTIDKSPRFLRAGDVVKGIGLALFWSLFIVCAAVVSLMITVTGWIYYYL